MNTTFFGIFGLEGIDLSYLARASGFVNISYAALILVISSPSPPWSGWIPWFNANLLRAAFISAGVALGLTPKIS